MAGARNDSFSHIVSATRLHFPEGCTDIPEATQEHLRAFVKSSQRLGVVAAIAVNALEAVVKRIAEEAAPGYKLHVLHVPCWGAFVPALNTLLEFAKRSGMKYILYQSLEVKCSAAVLQKLLGHFDNRVLVVGPQLPGHTFESGQQILNGRTTPWNTLALWSVRKLALTGFLQIADGIAATSQNNPSLHGGNVDDAQPMGSNGWWSRKQIEASGDSKEVPAGVEEVTAVALIQHLLGVDRAFAVLLQLDEELSGQVSWNANWGQDERRKQWHEYKMMSKVSRPAAQLQELFSLQKPASTSDGLPYHGSSPTDTTGSSAEVGKALPNSAVVMHYSESIQPPPHVEKVCLAALGLFYANSTAVLASAFQYINACSENVSIASLAFIALLIGGVYVMMPFSLQLTRVVTTRFGHSVGLALFASILLTSHLSIIASQLLCSESWQHAVLLGARITQGLGSGVLFQARHVLVSLSTSDHHVKLQARMFIAGDIGLGLGALLPAAASTLVGRQELSTYGPDVLPSATLAFICFAFLVWILAVFPRHLHFLPANVRFVDKKSGRGTELTDDVSSCPDRYRKIAWMSGTMRVFVQSAIMPAVALLLHDMNWTGNFRQSLAVALLCLLAIPFEAIGSRICCACAERAGKKSNTEFNKLVLAFSGAVLFLCIAAWPSALNDEKQLALPLRRLVELTVLVVALALAAPFHASRLNQLPDAERSMVVLEWLKAYIGRLLGPFVAVMTYTLLGYGSLLSLLSLSTLVVTVTA